MTTSIFDLRDRELSSAQAKITYLGEQKKPIPTVVFSRLSYPVVMERFLKVQASSVPYGNDDMPYTKSFSVTPLEFQRFLHSVKPLLTIADIGKGRPFLSFTLVVEEDNHVRGQEIRIGYSSGKEFYKLLINALQPENKAGIEAISKQEAVCYP